MTKYISLLFISVIIVFDLFAQSSTTDKEVMVISKYKSVIADADKIDNTPILLDTVKSEVKFSYSLNPRPEFSMINLYSENAPIIKGEPLSELDGGYLKFGGGNYSTWMGQFAFNNKRSMKYDWGIYLYNKYSDGKVKIKNRGKESSGYTNTDALIYGKMFFDKSVASVSLNYNFDKLRYYGYAESPDQINAIQKFNDIGINLSYSSVYKHKLDYKADFSYNSFKDEFSNWEENIFVAKLNVKADLSGSVLSGDFCIDYLGQNKWTDYSIFSFNPNYNIETGRFIFDFGAGVSLKTGGDKKLYFYPKTRINYGVVKDIMSIYVFAEGGVKKNTLSSVSKDNPFAVLLKEELNISSEINKTTFSKYNIGGGVKGQLARFVSFNIGASYKEMEDGIFYSNYRQGSYGVFVEEKYYSPVYDNVKLFNIVTEFSADIDENIAVSSVFNYYKYSLSNLKYAIHKPEAELRFSIDYNYNSKLELGVDMFYIGERYGGNYKQLDASIDVCFNVEYKFSDYVYSFLKINNLFDTKYEKWQGYPNYGINLMAGVSFSF